MVRANRQITLAARPTGAPTPSDFALKDAPMPEPGEGEVLLQTLWLSLDPYMRGRMHDGPSYATPTPVGAAMQGGTVGRVVASRDPKFKEGDIALGYGGWQQFWAEKAKGLMKLDPNQAPVTTALGVLGMPGFTGWYGLTQIGKPKAGETVVVAAASGPVGSMVAQLARLKGANAVAIAGGKDKAAWLRQELGLETALDHRSPSFAKDLAAAAPKGIDVYFENVGGHVFESVLPLMNNDARIPVCGIIAHYNDTAARPGPDRLPGLMGAVLRKRLLVQGFIISFRYDLYPQFLREVAPLVREGRIRYREDVVEGLEKAPEAFIGLLQGKNFGKLLVKVA
jgi:NADPH-dependent curcumin reductase CurA